ncbi:inositol monophosphatase [Candidatus Dependentiae bacterium]|nr:inositol monophosphatase [Candidatus Dependentiae bacterium]
MTTQGVCSEKFKQIIKKAGDILLEHYGKRVAVHEKAPLQLVTEADLASERFLKHELLQLLPGASIISEEHASQPGNDYCWVIDPLDGTNNFAHEISYFCISVALMYQNTIIQGAIFQPVLNEFFYAERNKGAWLNDVKIEATPRVSSPMIAFTYLEAREYAHLMTQIPFPYSFRHLGAAALDLAYVACGRLHGMISRGLSWWDLAAGVLLVQEAGGVVTDFYGSNIHQQSASCFAAPPHISTLLMPILSSEI